MEEITKKLHGITKFILRRFHKCLCCKSRINILNCWKALLTFGIIFSVYKSPSFCISCYCYNEINQKDVATRKQPIKECYHRKFNLLYKVLSKFHPKRLGMFMTFPLSLKHSINYNLLKWLYMWIQCLLGVLLHSW